MTESVRLAELHTVMPFRTPHYSARNVDRLLTGGIVMTEYISVPIRLTEEVLIREYGADAVRFYKKRIYERERQGHIYLNHLKTIFIWAAKDRKTCQGYWSTWKGVSRKKHKNYGGS